jgi:hypothetical protein
MTHRHTHTHIYTKTHRPEVVVAAGIKALNRAAAAGKVTERRRETKRERERERERETEIETETETDTHTDTHRPEVVVAAGIKALNRAAAAGKD